MGIAAKGCAGIQDRRDVGVIELGENAALVLKAAEEEIVDLVVAEDFDGDAFFEAAVGSGGFKNDCPCRPGRVPSRRDKRPTAFQERWAAEDGFGCGMIDETCTGRISRQHAAKLLSERRRRIPREMPGVRSAAAAVPREGPRTSCGVG